MCSTTLPAASTINEDTSHKVKSNIKLTNKGTFIYAKWSKEQLINLLKNKLLQCSKSKLLPVCYDVQYNVSFDTSLRSIIHSGIYNECVLKELEEKGMLPRNIMKVMKYGLLSLTFDELKYFEGFGTEMYVIKTPPDMWPKKLDYKLIWNLIITGLNEIQCWNIVMCGLISQNGDVLFRLLASGVDVPGILDWQEQIKSITPTMMCFLKKLEIDEDIVRCAEESGIDDEIEDMLIDLGYNEYKEKEALEITEEIYKCDLSILDSHFATLEEKTNHAVSDNSSLKAQKSCSCSLNQTAASSNVSSSVNVHHLAPFICRCHFNLLPNEQYNKTLKRNDYLRQNVMVPLSWAISRALRYQPSDPKHYIAHQLLRWKYGNVPQDEIDNAQKFVASATMALDRRFVEQHKQEDATRCLSNPVIKKVDCSLYLERNHIASRNIVENAHQSL